MPAQDGGLGSALVGEKIVIGPRHVAVSKLLGEGGFSYVYLVKELADTAQGGSMNSTDHRASGSGKSSRSGSNGSDGKSKRAGSLGKDQQKAEMVLKVTSILSRQQRDIAEKEAKLLSRLSHPSIIKMYDTCYRTVQEKQKRDGKTKERPQHLILMEFCEGGHALDVCTQLAAKGEKFDLSSLIIAFGQICNAVSYLHAQRPPIVHRDLKPANFLIKNGAYKLCDFGSAVFGHVDLKTPEARNEAEEVIEKTTTQMFRAPEMVDLFVAKKLTQATDVWALGACLYSLAFLQNCFEEGSNLAILSRKYKIPDDNPYGDGLVELLDRMLTVDSKARADMTEVILCLSAVYSRRPLPPRKEKSSSKKKEEKEEESSGAEKKSSSKSKKSKSERVGTFRTDGQGIYEDGFAIDPKEAKKAPQAKKLDPNSAAARRKKSAAAVDSEFATFENKFGDASALPEANAEAAFSTSTDAFSAFGDSKSDDMKASATDIFASFDVSDGEASGDDVKGVFEGDEAWGASGDIQFESSFATFGEAAAKAGSDSGDGREDADGEKKQRRSGAAAPRTRRSRKKSEDGVDPGLEGSMDDLGLDDGPEEEADGSGDRRRSRTSRTRVRRTERPRRKNDDPDRSKSRDRKDKEGVEADEDGVIEEDQE
eukprot:CAMPEP_0172455152 /NCGR_PEP_ID=MMETSP1065-20121228/11915_1 /TAXON_ID=265537 /ORGANISM="Amphiprora paludosa, Strain CCMP125" /LENGTH=651 /DNA_ID=CAMNT_0013207609 /DNA_START=205 /DNA_END=2160 /DNA_ORIENTATION=+